ncbi:MAG: DUF389 domain-containing protein [Chitinophagaceae bacterium]
MHPLLEKFALHHEKEDYVDTITAIERGVVFRGTNLWVLIIAIFVASLGLNVNSTAVIIGAMLISPLMGPIMGLGLSLGIYDVPLLKKSGYNYAIATLVALTTSTIYFLVSPINDAHSEILARTSPNIYDVLIAFFGGGAGMLATASKQKGNVVTGVAIATALMPPLCTAGYGLATQQWQYFFGAFYLYFINTVFIAFATYVVTRLLKFPLVDFKDIKKFKSHQRIAGILTLLTVLPSIYFGYEMIKENHFEKVANTFIDKEAHFPNDYLLQKKIEPKTKKITLVFGGAKISDTSIEQLQHKLNTYYLPNATVNVMQGFTYLTENDAIKNQQLALLLADAAQKKQASVHKQQLFNELVAISPDVSSIELYPTESIYKDSIITNGYTIIANTAKNNDSIDTLTLKNWLQQKLQTSSINLIITP